MVLSTVSAVFERQTGTIAIPDEVTRLFVDGAVVSPMVWLHLAVKVTTAGNYVDFRSVRIYEVP